MAVAEKPATITIRMGTKQHAAVKKQYWATAAKHELPFNTWMCKVIEAGMKVKI